MTVSEELAPSSGKGTRSRACSEAMADRLEVVAVAFQGGETWSSINVRV